MYIYTKLNSLAQKPLGVMAKRAHIRFRDQGYQGAKHMSWLGGLPNRELPVFSSQACLFLSLSTH